MKYSVIHHVKRSLLIGIAAVSLFGNCAYAGSDTPVNHSTTPAPKKVATIGGIDQTTANANDNHGDNDKPHWSYEGPEGPTNWGRLSSEFGTCESGTMQSPIDITDTFGAGGAKIEFDYKVTTLDLIHNGHTVQLNYEKGSSITVDGKRYELLQLHFHTPSEHAVGAKQSAMEMHLVHKNAEGELAVVGVMLDVGGTNRALGEMWAHMPASGGQTHRDENVLVNARDLLPSSTSAYYRYMGSLTTPPCSEGVNWFVLTTPVAIGIEQVKRFADAVGFNARPLQPKYKRLVIAPISGN